MSEPVVTTKCVNAAITEAAYAKLVADGGHGHDALPCLRDECPLCVNLNNLIDVTGDNCESRGCTLLQCIYDPVDN